MKFEAHVQIRAFEAKHFPQPRAHPVVQRQRTTTISYLDHVVLMKSDHTAAADRIGELRHCSCCIGLIHEDATANNCVERAALWKSDIESTLDECDVRNAGLVRLFSSQLEHLRVLIDADDVSLVANATRKHERHRARPAADIEHAHARTDARIVEHSFGHLVDSIWHRHVISLGLMGSPAAAIIACWTVILFAQLCGLLS
jgi:hypothetical protein